jgi:hypothetical protein
VIALALMMTLLANGITVAAYSAIWGLPDYYWGIWLLIAVLPLQWSGSYILMQDSVIEDGVKSAMLAVLGCLVLRHLPFIGVLGISVAFWAFIANAIVRSVRSRLEVRWRS